MRILQVVGESTSFGSGAAVVTPGRTAGSDVCNSFRGEVQFRNCQTSSPSAVKNAVATTHKSRFMFATFVLAR